MNYASQTSRSSTVEFRRFSDVRFLGPSKYAARCIFCENPVSVGEMVYWIPNTAVMHEQCLYGTSVMGRPILDQSTGDHLCPICWSSCTTSDMFHPTCLSGYVAHRKGQTAGARTRPFVSIRAYRSTIVPGAPVTPPLDENGTPVIAPVSGPAGSSVSIRLNRILSRDDVLHALQDSALAPFIDPGSIVFVQGES